MCVRVRMCAQVMSSIISQFTHTFRSLLSHTHRILRTSLLFVFIFNILIVRIALHRIYWHCQLHITSIKRWQWNALRYTLNYFIIRPSIWSATSRRGESERTKAQFWFWISLILFALWEGLKASDITYVFVFLVFFLRCNGIYSSFCRRPLSFIITFASSSSPFAFNLAILLLTWHIQCVYMHYLLDNFSVLFYTLYTFESDATIIITFCISVSVSFSLHLLSRCIRGDAIVITVAHIHIIFVVFVDFLHQLLSCTSKKNEIQNKTTRESQLWWRL